MNDRPIMSVIDLETGSTTARSVILSVGITTLDAITFEKIGQIYINVNPYCPDNSKREWCNETRSWWQGQSKEAIEEAMRVADTVPLLRAMEQVKAYVKILEETGDVHVFGNGSEFDLAILANAFEQLEIKTPWGFGNAQSIRTIVWIGQTYFGVDFKKSEVFQGTKHNALHDSNHEARYAAKTLKYIKNIADKHSAKQSIS